MKLLPDDLISSLESGVTTLCWCWRLTRRDGAVTGFTDHDRDVSFDGTIFEAEAGFTASEMKDSIGLNVDNVEVTSALSSERLGEADLVAGLFDDATVEIYRVDWSDPASRVLMRTGNLGEVRRAGGAFTAEVRGLSHYLQQQKGRLYQFTCDRDVGDTACGVDLNQATYTGTGSVVSVISDRRFEVSGLETFESDWFTRGLLTFVDGAAAGQGIEVKSHGVVGGIITIDLWGPVREPLVAGQTFTITAGCDKCLETCRLKFDNVVNFRGFPHMPGNDFVATPARSGGASR